MPYSKSTVTPEWIPVTDAAGILSCDPRTLIRMIKRGELEVRVMPFGKSARVHRGDFDREIAKRVSIGLSA